MKLTSILVVLTFSGLTVNGQQDTLKTFVDTDTSSAKEQYLPDKIAEFHGGTETLMEYLHKNISYPQKAIEDGIAGIVIIQFVVEKDGSITNVKIKRSVHPLLDSAAVKLISAMPAWMPGEQQGKIKRSLFILPVNFQLGNVGKHSKKSARILRRYERKARKNKDN